MTGQNREDIKMGIRVNIIQKCDQITGKLTEGIIRQNCFS